KPNNICSSVNLLRFIANTPFLLIDILPDSLIYSGSIFREEISTTGCSLKGQCIRFCHSKWRFKISALS
ncbi:hypothetical protein, partial [Legionella sp. 28fT52]|uniref:hypothetical protein n=1 Tax=Legionella sp. 28fT52 TaxID=3410134 RepID=UPI003AF849CF